jgi:hypothetical protein
MEDHHKGTKTPREVLDVVHPFPPGKPGLLAPHASRRRHSLTPFVSSCLCGFSGIAVPLPVSEFNGVWSVTSTAVDERVMRFSLSSGRRPLPQRSGCYLSAAVCAVIALVSVFELTRGDREPPPAPAPTVAPSPTQAPSATPTRLAEYASGWVTAIAPTGSGSARVSVAELQPLEARASA